MKKIIAFAGSNSKKSINKQLVTYAVSLMDDFETQVLDLNDFELPIFSVDLEQEQGIPENAHEMLNHIKSADGIILSLAEHNGAYSAVFKNILDWMSRIEGKTFYGKPMLLMAASSGGRGGASVLQIALDRFPRHNAEIINHFSFPSFGSNFSDGKIINEELDNDLKKKLKTFQNAL